MTDDGGGGGDDVKANIRTFLGHLIGARVLDVTQHDPEEFYETGEVFVELSFDTGARVRFYVDRFEYDDAVEP